MKRVLFLLPLALAACSHDSSSSGPGGPGAGEGPLINTASLSATTQAQLCPPDGPALQVPDLAPEPFDAGATWGPDPCSLIEVAVGGPNACCGGDLTTQSCGPGLQCFHPGASDIGLCLTKDATDRPSSVCIDRHQPAQCSFYAVNNILIDNDPNRLGCQLEAHCGAYGEYQYNCDSGSCSCLNDAANIASFPEGSICSGSVDAALKIAQANCNFPTSYPEGRATDPWQ